MNTAVTVTFSSMEVPWRSLRGLFVRCELADLASEGASPINVYHVTLDEDAEQLQCLLRSLSAMGLTWALTRQNVYTRDELRSAPFLRLLVDRAPQGIGGPRYGTEYDLTTACPKCGSGAQQTSPLVLDEGDLPKRGPIYKTLDGQILVSERLKSAIQLSGTKGMELWEAIGFQSSRGIGFFQILAPALPPMHPATEGVLREAPCPDCGRDGHFDSLEVAMRIRYRAKDLAADEADAYFTHEWFGNSKLRTPFTDSQLAHPLLLVSTRIYEVLAEQRVPNVTFDPVEIE